MGAISGIMQPLCRRGWGLGKGLRERAGAERGEGWFPEHRVAPGSMVGDLSPRPSCTNPGSSTRSVPNDASPRTPARSWIEEDGGFPREPVRTTGSVLDREWGISHQLGSEPRRSRSTGSVAYHAGPAPHRRSRTALRVQPDPLQGEPMPGSAGQPRPGAERCRCGGMGGPAPAPLDAASR